MEVLLFLGVWWQGQTLVAWVFFILFTFLKMYPTYNRLLTPQKQSFKLLVASKIIIFRLTISLPDGIYYWAVSAFNSVTGPLSAVSSVIVCVSYFPRFSIVFFFIIQPVPRLLICLLTGVLQLRLLHLHGL